MMLASKVGICSDPEIAGIIQTRKVGGKKKERKDPWEFEE